MRSDRASRASETVAKPARARQFQAMAEASGRLAWVVSIVGSDISWIPRTGRGSSKRVRIDGNGAGWQGRAGGYAIRGLPENFQKPDQCQIQLSVSVEIGPYLPSHHLQRLPSIVSHLAQTDRGVTLRHTALRPRKEPVLGNKDSGTPRCSGPPCAPKSLRALPPWKERRALGRSRARTRREHPRRSPARSHPAKPSRTATAFGRDAGGRTRRSSSGRSESWRP